MPGVDGYTTEVVSYKILIVFYNFDIVFTVGICQYQFICTLLIHNINFYLKLRVLGKSRQFTQTMRPLISITIGSRIAIISAE